MNARYDAILIPGGGVRPGGELPPWVERRLERALEYPPESFLVLLSAGTTHRPPPLDERGFPIFESVAAARWLLRRGVAPGRILTETCSYDTIGNAYFARVIHTAPRGFARLLVITSEFHLPRTEAIFRWVYGLDDPASAVSLAFQATPNDGIPPAALEARIQKERDSLGSLPALTGSIRTLAQLHAWLFTRHAAYAAGLPSSHLHAGDAASETY